MLGFEKIQDPFPMSDLFDSANDGFDEKQIRTKIISAVLSSLHSKARLAGAIHPLDFIGSRIEAPNKITVKFDHTCLS